jgi:hypothetical protein
MDPDNARRAAKRKSIEELANEITPRRPPECGELSLSATHRRIRSLQGLGRRWRDGLVRALVELEMWARAVFQRGHLTCRRSARALYQKILALDTALFDSFNKCSNPAEFRRHAAFFAKEIEFYHDLGGVTVGVDDFLANTRKNVCGKFRRELDLQSFRVFPIPGYGAMAIGTHRFCHTPDTCEGVAEFTTLWREKDGVWQIARALSYAHRSL